MKSLFTSFIAPISAIFMGASTLASNADPITESPNAPALEHATNVGGSFSHLTDNFFINKSVNNIDRQFQFILDEMSELEDFSGPFYDKIKAPYSSRLDSIAKSTGYNEAINPKKNRDLDLCASKYIRDFFRDYSNKLDTFLNKDHPQYKLVLEADKPDVLKAITKLKTDIGNFDKQVAIYESFELSNFKRYQCYPIG